MTWFKVDSRMYAHPAALVVGDDALGLWLRLGCWLADFPKQGDFVTESIAKHLGKRRQLAKLIDAGLLEPIEGGYRLYAHLDRCGSGLPDRMWAAQRTEHRTLIPNQIRDLVYRRDGHACVACGSGENLSLDHIWPWSKGGDDNHDNLQTLCRSCNSSKGARI